jgi:hypothetical protein
MLRGDKSKYTKKEKRQAEHIEEGYEERGTPKDEAKRRAWATVNAVHGGGEKPGGGGYGNPRITSPCARADEHRTRAEHTEISKERRAGAKKRKRASDGCPFC